MQLYQASFYHEFGFRQCKRILPQKQYKFFEKEENAKQWVTHQYRKLQQVVLMLHRDYPEQWPDTRISHEKYTNMVRYMVDTQPRHHANLNGHGINGKKLNGQRLRCQATSQIKVIKTADNERGIQ